LRGGKSICSHASAQVRSLRLAFSERVAPREYEIKVPAFHRKRRKWMCERISERYQFSFF
jgi:hypothetical protein